MKNRKTDNLDQGFYLDGRESKVYDTPS